MKSLKAKKILIMAGPTREYIDPVRYISNDSSGLMGFAIANEAVKKGARVTLISGPVSLKTTLTVKHVISAREMFLQVKKYYKKSDIIICSAAVADFRPAKYSDKKLKKASVKHFSTLSLVPNKDILNFISRHKRKSQFLVGFALETENLIKNALKKMKQKHCDMMIANDASVIGKKKSSVIIINKKCQIEKIALKSKQCLAKKIISAILKNS